MFEARMAEFRRRLGAAGLDVAVITDDDSVYYLTGYYDYLHMDFGRPTTGPIRSSPVRSTTPEW